MPLFDFECSVCGHAEERSIAIADFDKPQECSKCGQSPMKRQFPVQAALGFIPFKPYYNEALDVDIHGFRERTQIYNALGLVEAGDPVGGARNIETAKCAVVMGPQPESGKTLADYQRAQDARREALESAVIGARDVKTGRTVKHRVVDMPSHRPSGKKVEDVLSHAVERGISAAKAG